MESSSVSRPFSALSGNEIKEIILNDIRRQLEGDYRFKHHLTYPQVSWKWVLAARVYPSDSPKIEVDLEKTVRATGKGPLDPDAPFEDVELTDQRTIAAPAAGETADSARRDAGLAVPAPRVVQGPNRTKMVVDAPDIPIGENNRPDRVAEVKTSSTADAVNRARASSASPARSVSVKTNANPGGFTPPDQAGSAPDQSRINQIIEREGNAPADTPEPDTPE